MLCKHLDNEDEGTVKAQVRGRIQGNSPSLNIPWNTASLSVRKQEGTAENLAKKLTDWVYGVSSERALGYLTKSCDTMLICINKLSPLWSITLTEWLLLCNFQIRSTHKNPTDNLIYSAKNQHPERKCFQHDNELMHADKSTKEWFKNNRHSPRIKKNAVPRCWEGLIHQRYNHCLLPLHTDPFFCRSAPQTLLYLTALDIIHEKPDS